MKRTSERSSRLAGLNVLVIEDEFYLAMDIKEEIERAGGKVLGPSGDSAASLSVMEQDRPDFAIVDINLGEGPSYEVAEELQRKNIPFVFLTGYDASTIPAKYADVQTFEKPADIPRIVSALSQLAGQ